MFCRMTVSSTIEPVTQMPADPKEQARLFRLHLVGVGCMGAVMAIVQLLPFLARLRFGATNWQTTVITAAVPVTQFFAIFWNHVYARVSTRTYLILAGALIAMPLALMGAARNIWQVMGLFVITAFGGIGGVSAMSPLNADLLRTCYPTFRHGRIFGYICALQFAATMIMGQTLGMWLDRDPSAFRIFFPLLALLSVAGLAVYGLMAGTPTWRNRRRWAVEGPTRWWEPLRDMGRVLKSDSRFAGYEAAFMSYGIGWMICTALVPVIATDRLRLNYSEFAQSTIVAYQATNMLLLVPLGRLSDRIGPMQLATMSFLWLGMYPIGLMLVPSAHWLIFCSILYAIGMVGVQLTWTLGPVSLAGDSARAPQYLAIHSTLVGVRGIVAQGLGMALYALTGRISIPLGIAMLGFLWAARRMRTLAQLEKKSIHIANEEL